MTEQTEIRVENAAGLHLRPAALFVQTAAQFQSAIKVRNQTRGGAEQDAKSAIGVMMLRCAKGDMITIAAEGEDAAAAVAALRELIEGDFASL